MKKNIWLYLPLLIVMLIASCDFNFYSDDPSSSISDHVSDSLSDSSEISSQESSIPNGSISQINLDSNNSPSGLNNEQYQDITHIDNHTSFQYHKAKARNNVDDHVVIGKMGHITNIDPITGLESFSINYDVVQAENVEDQYLYGFGYIRYRLSKVFIDNPNDYGIDIIGKGQLVTVNVSSVEDANFISFYTPAEVNITSLSFNFEWGVYQEPVKDDFSIQVITTNDVHGQIDQSSSLPGIRKLAAGIKQVQSNSTYNILIDNGDLWQGGVETWTNDGRIMTDVFAELGYEAVTLGNHEFDWGEDLVANHIEYSPFPYLANNIRYKSNNLSPSWATPYKLIQRNGVKIGIIGSIGDVYSSISYSQVSHLYFLTGSELTNQIKLDSNALKAQRADFIIYSIHDGAGYTPTNGFSSITNGSGRVFYDVGQLSGDYVDLVLQGHTHRRYAAYDEKGVWHIQNSGYGATFYSVQLQCNYDSTTDKYTVTTSLNSNNNWYYTNTYMSSLSDHPVVDKIENWYVDNVYGEIKYEVLTGNTNPGFTSEQIRNKVAELYYTYALDLEGAGSPTAPILGGGFLSTRSPFNLRSGAGVIYGEVFNLLPFDNDLVLCSILGDDLIDRYITNSTYYTYPYVNQHTINPSNTYYIITDTFNLDFAPNNLTLVTNYTLEYGLYARDLFADFLKSEYGPSSSQEPSSWDGQLPDGYVSLATILAEQQVGKIYTTRSTITNINGRQIFLQDDDGSSLFIFNSGSPDISGSVVIGNVIDVTGYFDYFNGLPELDNASATLYAETKQTPIEPLLVSSGAMLTTMMNSGLTYNTQLIRLNNVTTGNISNNVFNITFDGVVIPGYATFSTAYNGLNKGRSAIASQITSLHGTGQSFDIIGVIYLYGSGSNQHWRLGLATTDYIITT
jgi:2',3'-cyclic-nucleotide 2'-phosphodiesterase (5'-nucleotidase family)